MKSGSSSQSVDSRPPTRRIQLTEKYKNANFECATIIIKNPGRYGGPDSLPVIWAQMFLNNTRVKTPAAWRLVA